MAVRVELFATGAVPPEDLWAVVGDVRRLPEWTDADRVERVEPDPVEVGTELEVVVAGHSRVWRVLTADTRVLEATSTAPRGPVGLGVRVVRERSGSRLVLAATFPPMGGLSALRVRVVDAPRLRRRFDRWTRVALELAAAVR